MRYNELLGVVYTGNNFHRQLLFTFFRLRSHYLSGRKSDILLWYTYLKDKLCLFCIIFAAAYACIIDHFALKFDAL